VQSVLLMETDRLPAPAKNGYIAFDNEQRSIFHFALYLQSNTSAKPYPVCAKLQDRTPTPTPTAANVLSCVYLFDFSMHCGIYLYLFEHCNLFSGRLAKHVLSTKVRSGA